MVIRDGSFPVLLLPRDRFALEDFALFLVITGCFDVAA
jgi:hypothetical protein